MQSSDGEGSNLKVLNDCILYHPFAKDWHCVECKNTISGGHREFIDHSTQTHEVSTPDEVMFPCDVCGLVFPIMDTKGKTESYSGHWLKHFITKDAALESNSCTNDVVCTAESQPLRNGRAQVLRKCEYCDECFDTTPSKEKHIWEKHPETLNGSTTCTLCNKTYPTKRAYRSHISSVHGNKIKPVATPCEICGKVLSSESSVKKHIENIHNGPTTNSVPCPLCPWKFRRQDLVSGHMKNTHKMSMKEYRKSLTSSDNTSSTQNK